MYDQFETGVGVGLIEVGMVEEGELAHHKYFGGYLPLVVHLRLVKNRHDLVVDVGVLHEAYSGVDVVLEELEDYQHVQAVHLQLSANVLDDDEAAALPQHLFERALRDGLEVDGQDEVHEHGVEHGVGFAGGCDATCQVFMADRSQSVDDLPVGTLSDDVIESLKGLLLTIGVAIAQNKLGGQYQRNQKSRHRGRPVHAHATSRQYVLRDFEKPVEIGIVLDAGDPEQGEHQLHEPLIVVGIAVAFNALFHPVEQRHYKRVSYPVCVGGVHLLLDDCCDLAEQLRHFIDLPGVQLEESDDNPQYPIAELAGETLDQLVRDGLDVVLEDVLISLVAHEVFDGLADYQHYRCAVGRYV